MTDDADQAEREDYIARCRLDEIAPARAAEIRAGTCVDVERRLFDRDVG